MAWVLVVLLLGTPLGVTEQLLLGLLLILG